MMKMSSGEKKRIPTICRSNEEYRSPHYTSIFLAGPSLRGTNVKTPWREEAIQIFKDKGFYGEIFIPEPFAEDYEHQFFWEEQSLKSVSCILFWIPRNDLLPGFTTNVEFGEWMSSGRVVLGYPPSAERMRYLHLKAEDKGIPITHTLEDTVENALKMVTWGNYEKDFYSKSIHKPLSFYLDGE